MATAHEQQLILEAIESAEKSLALAKKLLGGSPMAAHLGTFEGEYMILASGKRYQIPPNYASKSLLVVGDTLRLMEEGAVNKFKQIEKVPRITTQGILTKKDGKWAVVCEQGSFWVLSAAVKHWEGEIGDEVVVQLPEKHKELKAQWAALEKVQKPLAPTEKDKVKPIKTVKKTTPTKLKPILKPKTKLAKPETTRPVEPKPKAESKVESKGEIDLEKLAEELR